jgi:lipopolysaccharide export system permease protein
MFRFLERRKALPPEGFSLKMAAMKRMHRYLIEEMLLPFGMALALISFLLLMNKLLTLVDLVLKHGVAIGTVLELVAYVMPATFAITVPMSLLVAVLLALGRLASDLELVALRSGGVSLAKLYPFVIALGLVFSLGMLAFNEGVLPRANEAYKVLFYDVLRQRSDVALQEKTWVKEFEGMTIFVDDKDPVTKELRGVTILRPEQPGQPLQWIRARRGKLVSLANSYRVYLDLYTGTMQMLGGTKGEDLTELAFKYSRLDLDIAGALGQINGGERQPQEMTMAEIAAAVAKMPKADPRRAHFGTEFHKKIAIPFACLFFMLCGFPLGTLTRKGGRMLGFVLAIVLIFVYYLMLSLGQTYGDDGRLPAWVAMWLPNFAMGTLAAVVGWSAFKERGIFAFARG